MLLNPRGIGDYTVRPMSRPNLKPANPVAMAAWVTMNIHGVKGCAAREIMWHRRSFL